MGRRLACGGLPFPGTGFPVLDFSDIYLVWNYSCAGYVFCNYPTPWRFCPQIFSKKKTWDKLPLTSPVSDLYTIVRIISKNVPGLATDFRFYCVVWGHGWTTCLRAFIFMYWISAIYTYYEIIHLWDTFFCTYPTPYDVSVHGLSFRKTNIKKKQMGQVTMDHLYIRGHGWTTCLQYDRPLLG